jgi:hypothetical protein
VVALVAQVVELQNHRVHLSAVSAGMSAQVLDNEAPRLDATAGSRVFDLLEVDLPAVAEVLAEARPTPMLTRVAGAVERLDGEGLTTASASLL